MAGLLAMLLPPMRRSDLGDSNGIVTAKVSVKFFLQESGLTVVEGLGTSRNDGGVA